MALKKLWVIAFRDLGRNRRRTGLTLLAVVLGLAVLIMMSGFIAGIFDSMISFSILLNSGHVQIRSENFKMEKPSLKWQDLLENSDELLVSAAETDGVTAVSPVLWASGFVNTSEELVGVSVTGIDPESGFHDPIREGMVAGEYLELDDREGVLIGEKLAKDLGIGAGSKISLLVNTSDGETDEDIFTVRGLFSTGIVSYDAGTVYMPLPKAQAITNAGERISAVILLTEDSETADPVAAALRGPGRSVVTWKDMNALILECYRTGYVLLLFALWHCHPDRGSADRQHTADECFRTHTRAGRPGCAGDERSPDYDDDLAGSRYPGAAGRYRGCRSGFAGRMVYVFQRSLYW